MITRRVPSGKRLHKLWNDPPCLMGKSTISMAFSNSYVELPGGCIEAYYCNLLDVHPYQQSTGDWRQSQIAYLHQKQIPSWEFLHVDMTCTILSNIFWIIQRLVSD